MAKTVRLPRLAACAAIASWLAWCPSADANFFKAKDIHDWCSSTDKGLVDICSGYILGVAEAMEGSPVDGYKACRPEKLMSADVIVAVTKYVDGHIELWKYSAASVIASAMEEAFPCK
jgi:hypothetical protein